tara:strand:- start:319 stop:426 length:108 start_codon:yes stop_codon:yes gene_type:complete
MLSYREEKCYQSGVGPVGKNYIVIPLGPSVVDAPI